ncbi:MAG: hypothetical protein KAH21_03995 [Spirochaetaceae bacterium]|nr:hypothetical protein [Spirochaetaceae bacterium]
MISHGQFMSFMEKYFEDYSQYAQDRDTMPKMDKYWTEDVQVTAYFQLEGGEYPFRMTTRREWQDFLIKGHLTIWENLQPIDLMVDTVQLKATSMLKVIKFDRKTDKELVNLDGIGYYKLIETNEGNLCIKSLDFFTGDASTFTKLYTMK